MREEDQPIISKYAAALLDAATKQQCLDEIVDQSRILNELLEKNPRLVTFLESPQIEKTAKQGLIRDTLGKSFHSLLISLFLLLIQKGRIVYLEEILELFGEQVEQKKGLFHGSVHTAIDLEKADRENLQRALERFTKCRLRLAFEVDPEILGGVIFQYQDTLVDSSLRGELGRLRATLEAVKVIG